MVPQLNIIVIWVGHPDGMGNYLLCKACTCAHQQQLDSYQLPKSPEGRGMLNGNGWVYIGEVHFLSCLGSEGNSIQITLFVVFRHALEKCKTILPNINPLQLWNLLVAWNPPKISWTCPWTLMQSLDHCSFQWAMQAINTMKPFIKLFILSRFVREEVRQRWFVSTVIIPIVSCNQRRQLICSLSITHKKCTKACSREIFRETAIVWKTVFVFIPPALLWCSSL